MAKKSNSAGQAPAKEKAKAGTSISARCKKLFLQMFTDLTEIGKLQPDTQEAAEKLYTDIPASQMRGLPLATQLSNTTAAINQLYDSVEIIDGKPAWETIDDRLRPLQAKKEKLLAAITKANKKKSESENETS